MRIISRNGWMIDEWMDRWMDWMLTNLPTCPIKSQAENHTEVMFFKIKYLTE